jgi:hypothetical protein
VTSIFDSCSADTSVEVSRARLLADFPFLGAARMTATEVRSLLSTKVVWG